MALPIANAGASPAPYEFGATPASVVLNGSGTPGTGAASITVYQWTILFDDGVAAALDDATDPAATLTGLPPEGSVRLFLRVTDNLGQQSEQDPTKAPNSAFILFSTKTEHLGVERVADGERDWGPRVRRSSAAACSGAVQPGGVQRGQGSISPSTPVSCPRPSQIGQGAVVTTAPRPPRAGMGRGTRPTGRR